MTAIATNKSLLHMIISRLFGAPKSEPMPEPQKESGYNPVADLCLGDLGKLRRTLANVCHMSDPYDATVLFDKVDYEACKKARDGQGELAELVRAEEEFRRNEIIAGVSWNDPYRRDMSIVRSKITGELGFLISRHVPRASTIAKLHTLPEYEELRTAKEIPTMVVAYFNEEETGSGYEFCVRCFLRCDQHHELASARKLMSEIQKGMHANQKARRVRRAA
jgi:hypothetical protein